MSTKKEKKLFLSHKIEIVPDEYTKSVLEVNFGYARYLYNLGIAWRNKLVEEASSHGISRVKLSSLDFSYFFQSREREWKEFEKTDKRIIGRLRYTVGNRLYEAYDNFFKNPKFFKPPKFHTKKNSNDNFKIPVVKTGAGYYDVRVEKGFLIFPKIIAGTRVPRIIGKCKIKENPRFCGKPISVIFLKDKIKYYVIFVYEVQKQEIDRHNSDYKSVGIDLGIKTLAICVDSNGDVFTENQSDRLYHYYQYLKVLTGKMNRSLVVNKYHKTKNYNRYYIKFCRTWDKIVNIRVDFIHKFTTSLVKKYSEIKIEDLVVSEMFKKSRCEHSINNAIASSCFRKIREILTYKCAIYGTKLYVVDRYFPSSQICSQCHNRKKMLPNERVYKCDHCNLEIDRDINAAINILVETKNTKQIC